MPTAALDDPRARDDHDEDGDGNDDDGKEVCATADGDRATLDGSRERLCTARAFVCAPGDAFRTGFARGCCAKNNLRKRVGCDATIPGNVTKITLTPNSRIQYF